MTETQTTPQSPVITDAINMARHLANGGWFDGLTRKRASRLVAREWAKHRGKRDDYLTPDDLEDGDVAVEYLIVMKEIEYAPRKPLVIKGKLTLDTVPAVDDVNPHERAYVAADFAKEIARCASCLLAKTLTPEGTARELRRIADLVELMATYTPVQLGDIINSATVRKQVRDIVENSGDGVTSRDIWRAIGDTPEYAAVPLQSIAGYVGAAVGALAKEKAIAKDDVTADGFRYVATAGRAPAPKDTK